MKEKESGFIDISALLRYWLKNWYWFLLSIAVFGAVGFVFVKGLQPKYAVRANIKIATGEGGGASAASSLLAGTSFGDIFGASADVQDEIFIITSHSVCRDVVKKMRLNVRHEVEGPFFATIKKYKDYPIDVTFDSIVPDTLRQTLTFNVEVEPNGLATISGHAKKIPFPEVENVKLPYEYKTPFGVFTIEKTPHYSNAQKVVSTVYVMGYDGAAEKLSEDIVVDMASKKSNVLNLAYDTELPEMGKDILNEIVLQYNSRGIADRSAQNEKAAKFISERLKLVQNDLFTAEADMQQFKEANNITNLEADATYQYTKRGEVENNLIKAQTQVEVLEMTRDFIHNPEYAYTPIPVTVLGDMQSASVPIQNYNNLVLEYIDLQAGALDENAMLINLREQVDAARNSIISGVDKSLEGARLEVAELEKQMGETSSHLERIPAQERKYVNLSRQANVKNELYLFLLQRQEETAMMIANTSDNAEIIDEAFQKVDPVSMPKIVIFAIFLMIGVMVPIVWLYIRRAMRNKFNSVEELEKVSSVPVIGEVCIDKSHKRLIVNDTDVSATSELFRLIRANLQFVLSGTSDKVVMVTSTRPGEGKSFISVNLAASLSLLNKKVLLMGMDIRAPRLADYLHLDPTFGVTQYLASPDIPLDECIEPVNGMPNLDVLTAGPVPPNPGELLLSERVDELFDELRRRYDYIIVDSAPVGMVSDTMTLMRVADATIYVCRANHTTLKDVRFFNDIYNDGRLKKMSLVVNGTKRQKGYGYGYGYGKKHKKK